MNNLTLRAAIKARKPKFRQQQAHMNQQQGGKWKKPRGLHSKMRASKRGKQSLPGVGYRGPRATYALDPRGKKTVLVSTLLTLEHLNKDQEVAILTHTLGLRKRLILLQRAHDLGITVTGFKDIPTFITTAKKTFEEKKKQHQRAQEQKKKAKETLEKKAAEQKTPPPEQPAAPASPPQPQPGGPS